MFDRKSHLERIANIKQSWTCLICGKSFGKHSASSGHLRYMHKTTNQEYYDNFVAPQEDKTCICGQKKAFLSVVKGYGKSCSIRCSESKTGERNGNFGKRHENMHSVEFKARIAEINRELKTGKPSKSKGKKLNLNDEQRQQLRERVAKTNENGFDNKGGRCKFFQVDGLLIQGRYELKYYLECEEKPKKPDRIKTPYGWYAPDFEFRDRFVEIKSTYTIKTCIYNKQSRKIVWVRNNVKPVEIKVLNEEETKSFLSHCDISEFLYQPSKN